MKLKKWSILALVCAGFVLGAGDKEVFDATVKHVDLGGNYLYFQNVTSLTGKLDELPALIRQFTLSVNDSAKDADFAADVAKVVLKILNPSVVKAFAASSVAVSPDCHVQKEFICCDTSTPSFLDFLPKNNHASAWQSLPADTKIALQGEIHLGELFNRTIRTLLMQRNPKLKMLPLKLALLKKYGVDVEAILNSLDGEIELLICGDNFDNVRAKVVLPDKNGTITALLQKNLPPSPNGIVEFPLPSSNGKKLLLIYGEKKISVVYGESLLKPAANEAKLISLPPFAAYSKLTPPQISSYAVINFDQKLIDSLQKLAAGNPEMRPVLDSLKPFSLVKVCVHLEDGIASTTASSFSVPDAMAVMPCKMFLLTIAALHSTRSKSQQIACFSNLKQLGQGLLTYANEHHGTFPATLDALKKDFVTDAKIYLCPQGQKPYVYLGAGVDLKKMQDPDKYPVLFDAPGCGHKDINVCFADGHVMSIKITDYRNPAQVIGVLNKKFHYAPEKLNALLAKAAEVK